MKKVLALVLTLVMAFSCAATVSAANNDFVPSIQIKPGPSVSEDDDLGAEIIMPDGTVIPVPDSAIIITPIADADEAEEDVRKALEEAYDDLKNADSLEDLIDKLQEILDEIADDVDVDDLVISDLFHVDLIGEYKKYVEEGGKLKVTFELTDDIVIALSDIDGVWAALFGDNCVDNGDGTYTLLLPDIGVYAFMKDSASVDVDPDEPGVSSPTTGDFTFVFVTLGTLCACAAVVFLVAAKKQKA